MLERQRVGHRREQHRIPPQHRHPGPFGPGVVEYMRRYPDSPVRLQVANTAAIAERLLRFSCDFALLEGEFSHSELLLEPWLADELVIFCAPSHPHQLSGGMAQRAALARALVNDPRLLILDEPLGKLDSLTRLAMQGEILRLWQQAGFSVLMVTHDVEEALFLANRVIVFSPRPARTVAELRVDLPYPRHRGQAQFVQLRQQALAHLGLPDSL